MGRLIYSAIMSLDGYVADESGGFDWAMPDEQVHRFANELERDIGTYLYGRRMYETMRVWDSPQMVDGQPPFIQEYATTWRAAEKIVYSRTLGAVTTPRTRLMRDFDAGAVQDLVRRADRDVSIGGPTIAAEAFRAGLVDECYVIIAPVAVGGGLPAFPEGGVRMRLLDERRFDSGMIYARYEIEGEPAS